MADAEIAMQHVNIPQPYPRRKRSSINRGDEIQRVGDERIDRWSGNNNGGYGYYLEAQKQDAFVEERPQASSRSSFAGQSGDEDLIPISTPPGHPSLDARPFILKKWCLIIILVFNLLALIGVCLLLWRSDNKKQFHTSYINIHFMVRYAPSILGTVTTIAGRSITYAFSRLDPYIAMADQKGEKPGRHGKASRTVGSAFLPPLGQLGFAVISRNGLRVMLLVNGIYVGFFVTGLKAGFLSSRETSSGWIVTVHPIFSMVLIVVYLLNEVVLLWIYFYLRNRNTGLKWDPTTLADQIALFHGSNILEDFASLEEEYNTFGGRLLQGREYRLGYWQKGANRDIWYGIGRVTRAKTKEASSATTRTYDQGTTPPTEQNQITNCRDGQHRPACDCRQSYYRPRTPYFTSSVVNGWVVIIWMPIILAALIACIVGLVQRVEKTGFSLENNWYRIFSHNDTIPTAPVNVTYDPSASRFDIIGSFHPNAANDLGLYIVVFRTLFVVIASLFAVGVMENIDLSIRFSQPFANMYRNDASASQSLLLNYLWGIPGAVTIEALKNRHWKVAWFSLLNLISPFFPILVGGLFTMTNTGARILFKVDESSFYLVFGYLVTYALSVPLVWPRTNRRLPRFCRSIADVMSLFYASVLMTNPALDISGKDVEQRHLESRLFLQEERFQMGIFTGVDGAKHFGMDYAELGGPGSKRQHVVKVGKLQKEGNKYRVNEERDGSA
ncbi:uncharacterized protein BDR25DRAFT_342976 [Lindgomyces ingoldianus]|uniref:Uncharacterized protein n=1 Tax=Lindgomyces ingoldianus TaxID=673940 RepID=A0ACB6QUL0_9PLEO|nr:uncharacterized protein BDR25DRAFT_342976 [Lindgomyces ingoldianus]KAF2470709.1 hypothetical protein BDR25DRAFT_342976 [Lindgomyces ingoldianus]